MTAPTDREQRFIVYLQELASRDDRAALAALRRGLGKSPGEAAESHRYVVPWTTGLSPRREDTFYQVAALFAWHPESWRGDEGRPEATNLGASLRRLAQQTGSASVEQRFVNLLNSHAEDLSEHLRRVVGLLKAHEIGIDWAKLLRDLPRWDWESRQVQRAWAREFWGRDHSPSDSATDLPPDVIQA